MCFPLNVRNSHRWPIPLTSTNHPLFWSISMRLTPLSHLFASLPQTYHNIAEGQRGKGNKKVPRFVSEANSLRKRGTILSQSIKTNFNNLLSSDHPLRVLMGYLALRTVLTCPDSIRAKKGRRLLTRQTLALCS